jgi:hypothetical protein
MSRIWRTIRSYVWWSYERGSVHYDVMVTLILIFIFLGPHWINFNDKPAERTPHQTGVLVSPEGDNFVYQIDAVAVKGGDESAVREQLEGIIEPISGEIEIERVETVRDKDGQITAYKVWVSRPY